MHGKNPEISLQNLEVGGYGMPLNTLRYSRQKSKNGFSPRIIHFPSNLNIFISNYNCKLRCRDFQITYKSRLRGGLHQDLELWDNMRAFGLLGLCFI